MKRLYHFDIISTGICYMSVCTDMTNRFEIKARANLERPTGIRSQWRLSKNKNFKTGEPNPCVCETHPDRKHYLLSC